MPLHELQPRDLRVQGRAHGRLSLRTSLRLRKALPVQWLRVLQSNGLRLRSGSAAAVGRRAPRAAALAAGAQYANTWKVGLQRLKIGKIRGVNDIASLSGGSHYHCIHEGDVDTSERNASDHGQ
jgi:hypothetical protein